LDANHLYIKSVSLCSHICHQIPERSFYVLGVQFPICARCTGIYSGVIFGIIVKTKLVRMKYLELFLLILSALALNTLSYINFFDVNILRYLFGFIFGLFCGQVIGKSVKEI